MGHRDYVDGDRRMYVSRLRGVFFRSADWMSVTQHSALFRYAHSDKYVFVFAKKRLDVHLTVVP